MSNSKSKLKIIPLGGLHEVGKNMTVFEYENDIFVLELDSEMEEDGVKYKILLKEEIQMDFE